MNWHRKSRLLPTFLFILLMCFIVAVRGSYAERNRLPDGAVPPVVTGYISAVHMPGGFDMNDVHVVMSSRTGVGYIGDKIIQSDTPLRAELRPGAFVLVTGDYDEHARTATAVTVFLLNERTRTRAGAGLILGVVTPGPEPVYRVDGYLIHVNLKILRWSNYNLQRLLDVGPNSILEYKGKIGADGIIEATWAQFARIVDKPDVLSSQNNAASDSPAHTNERAHSPTPNEDKLQMWHAIPPDQQLQQRVARIGMSLVPASLCEETGNHLSKIDYSFYVVDDEKMRDGYAIFDKHVILIPKQTAERLQNDSQLAAVLAEGIAQTLQMREITKGKVTEYTAGAAVSGVVIALTPLAVVGYATVLIPAKYRDAPVQQMPYQDQRDRIALGLMADAGYDPHQAPETWRLLAAGHPAPDSQPLPYPLRSEYQLSVLNIMYETHRTPVAASPK
jgi:hypothetical protein